MPETEIYGDEFVKNLAALLVYERSNDIRNGLYDLTQAAMSYHSNRIEGSPLSYENTWELYDKGEVLSEETIHAQDITDAQGHFLMFGEMIDHLDEPISEEMLCSWHGALKSGSYMDRKRGFAIGEYKKLNNAIGGLVQTVGVEDVPEEMTAFLSRYYSRMEAGRHTFKSLALSHQAFEHIHPFQDGNGRVGRMLLFRQCLDNGIVPCIIHEDMSREYKKALADMAFSGDATTLAEILEGSSKQYAEASRNYVEAFQVLSEKEKVKPKHKR